MANPVTLPSEQPLPESLVFERDDDAGVYVHFPYCLQKCPYCDFNSHVPRPGLTDYAAYTQAVFSELEQRLPELAGTRLRSIFFGGGTPSLWSPEAVAGVIDLCKTRLGVRPEDPVEITLEANPSTIEVGKLDDFRGAGITRVSMGVQALSDPLLRRLGRMHDRATALKSLEKIQSIGFTSHSIDLIYAVPGQSAADWTAALKEAVDTGVPHLSAYALTYEPDTLMTAWKRSGKIQPVDDDVEAEMFAFTHEFLQRRGLTPYEVSNFARPGHSSVHNSLYWRSQPYLGVGAGAHSFTGQVRRAAVRMPEDYIAAWGNQSLKPHPFVTEEPVSRAMHRDEQALMGLRTTRGWDTAKTDRDCREPGLESAARQAALAVAQAHPLWCEFDGRFLRPTPAGLQFNNDLVLAASLALEPRASRRASKNQIDGKLPAVRVPAENSVLRLLHET